MRNTLLITFLVILSTSIAQIENNQRKPYEEVCRLIRPQVEKLPEQIANSSILVIEVPTQEELIKQHRVKTKTTIYEEGSSINYYDENGMVVKWVDLDDTTTYEVYFYHWNEKEELTRKVTRYSNGESITRGYVYDEKGRVIVETYTNADLETSYKNFYYDDVLNTIIELNEYGIDKQFLNEDGLRVHFDSYDDTYRLMGVVKTTYSEKGLAIEENSELMGIRLKDSFEYNDLGQLLKKERSGIVNATFQFT